MEDDSVSREIGQERRIGRFDGDEIDVQTAGRSLEVGAGAEEGIVRDPASPP